MVDYKVVNAEQLDADLKVVADAIRSKGGTTEQLEFPQGMKQAVEAIQSGGDSLPDAFWKMYLNNGNGTNLNNGFIDKWTKEMFRPTYNIVPTHCDNMFFGFKAVTDLSQYLKDCGVVLDFSKCTIGSYAFYGTKLETIPELDLTSMSSVTVFIGYNNDLRTIEKMVFSTKNAHYNYAFLENKRLETLIAEGEIRKNFDLSQSPLLSNESAKSILTCLVNYTGTNNEFVNTVKFHQDVWARLDTEGETSPTGTTWKKYVEDKGWLY